MKTDARKNLRRFAQQALGCGCPPEVFEDIRQSRFTLSGLACERILIGNRLLIYLLEPVDLLSPDAFERIFRQGLSERDQEGYHRFRMVIVGEVDGRLRSLFDTLCQGDEKAHLHWLSGDQFKKYPIRGVDA